MLRAIALSWVALAVPIVAGGTEVSGRIVMPETCSSAISPAVVLLEPIDGQARQHAPNPARVTLVNQRGLQFVPRVGAMTVGQTLRFTNADSETHNVHILADGTNFSQSMAPGRDVSYQPERPGVLRLVCDIHSHMRGFVVVGDSPWVSVCDREGLFRFRDVPDGRYDVKVWHEFGDGLRKQANLVVSGAGTTDLKPIVVGGAATVGQVVEVIPARTWGEVIDRIGVRLAGSLDRATHHDQGKARALADDAYFVEFEGSDMEAAVRSYLGFEKKGELEDQFRAFRRTVREIAAQREPVERGTDLSGRLLLNLSHSAEELNRRGIVDRSKIAATAGANLPLVAGSDRQGQWIVLAKALDLVQERADGDDPAEASSAMTDAYFDGFEPMERSLSARDPSAVRRLEVRFNAIRGEVGSGLKGRELAGRIDGLKAEIRARLDRADAASAGPLALAFMASLSTILREGVEVILLLTMLIALAAKAERPGASAAIRWGVGAAVLASLATALALNLLVASVQGRTRERLEGWVMLAAAGVLFYVSYWLISRTESKRWTDFLKRRARHGTEIGGYGALGLTAFLAVYREGAETALMYQAMVGDLGRSRAGLIGIGAGLAVGLGLLAVIYLVLRKTSVRLPFRTFFKLTGLVLFAMAVVFAGHGVFELQSSGLIVSTPLSWLGDGLPILGVYPNVQALSIQGLLLAGAGLALVLMAIGGRSSTVAASNPQTTAGVGVRSAI